MIAAVAAYTLWGLLPLYLKLLDGVPAPQILAHRIAWSLLLMAAIVTVVGRWRAIAAALRAGRTLPMLIASATLIAVNWLIYIWAVMNGHILAASLGYFINPLVNVALAMLVLGERLRPLQIAAVALALVGVGAMALDGGWGIWLSLSLAFSFAGYGLIRKLAPIDALGGLTVETGLLAPIAIGFLLWIGLQGGGAFGQRPALDGLLVLSGVVTAVPLLLFAVAARRLRFTTVGLLQYIAPTVQFLLAVLLYGEPLLPIHLVTFGCIWAGCALYTADTLRAARAAAPIPAV